MTRIENVLNHFLNDAIIREVDFTLGMDLAKDSNAECNFKAEDRLFFVEVQRELLIENDGEDPFVHTDKRTFLFDINTLFSDFVNVVFYGDADICQLITVLCLSDENNVRLFLETMVEVNMGNNPQILEQLLREAQVLGAL